MSHFRLINRDTGFLLPPSVDDWLPERHLARFVVEVIEQLDLSAMERAYRGAGSASYHPALLLGLLVYGYATGVFSSRKLERATYDSVAFRFIAANQHPDHDTIATFRRRFLKQIGPLFVQVLRLAREMGVLALEGSGLAMQYVIARPDPDLTISEDLFQYPAENIHIPCIPEHKTDELQVLITVEITYCSQADMGSLFKWIAKGAGGNGWKSNTLQAICLGQAQCTPVAGSQQRFFRLIDTVDRTQAVNNIFIGQPAGPGNDSLAWLDGGKRRAYLFQFRTGPAVDSARNAATWHQPGVSGVDDDIHVRLRADIALATLDFQPTGRVIVDDFHGCLRGVHAIPPGLGRTLFYLRKCRVWILRCNTPF